jgi:hypothetical protein
MQPTVIKRIIDKDGSNYYMKIELYKIEKFRMKVNIENAQKLINK